MTTDHSTSMIVIFIILVLIFLLIKHLSSQQSQQPRPSGAQVRYLSKPLLSSWEAASLPQILSTMPDDTLCFAQVRLADMVQAKGDTKTDSFNANRSLFGKSVDFAIYHPSSRSVLMVYELNDKTHNRPDRQARDRLVHTALADAGIPLTIILPGQSINVNRDIRAASRR